ncbi:hypothetical protein EC973_008215 [Apophysomyces ossiformis]|uniref:Uncharacterized protein n=1 Tax=Apophysomyces ossiformis TaxID=679940 RepID=A0A8H7BX42_9FUNG|nr:hypothetical protein EC973_008215 [Apophysomyces ossiformis]
MMPLLKSLVIVFWFNKPMQPFNKYYPPDWTPEKGTVNQHVGKHPLGARARKIDQGILVVRQRYSSAFDRDAAAHFPCTGVRYNAEKKKIGNYYSTPILQFRMKCHLCSQWIEIHTDPKNAQYVVVSGARKKVEEWEPEDSEVIRLKGTTTIVDEETKEKLETDAMYRLEHGIKDKKAFDETVPVLTQIQQLNDSQWKDPYARSQELRRKFRETKKKEKAIEQETERLRDKNSLHINLLPESPSDAREAQLVEYAGRAQEDVNHRKLEKTVSPLFGQLSMNQFADDLGKRASLRTRLKTDPFLRKAGFSKTNEHQSDQAKAGKPDNVAVRPIKKMRHDKAKEVSSALVNYTDSDSDSNSNSE